MSGRTGSCSATADPGRGSRLFHFPSSFPHVPKMDYRNRPFSGARSRHGGFESLSARGAESAALRVTWKPRQMRIVVDIPGIGGSLPENEGVTTYNEIRFPLHGTPAENQGMSWRLWQLLGSYPRIHADHFNATRAPGTRAEPGQLYRAGDLYKTWQREDTKKPGASPGFLFVNVLTAPDQPSAEFTGSITGSTASSVSLSSAPTGRKLRYFSSFLCVILTT